jgi:NAD(P)-dependent dehydrogenase (short-subunit alcohol dehydrogenase family)
MAEARWALVVGASRGLGLGLAAELQRRGWNVVATVRDEAGRHQLQDLGGAVEVESLDINDDAGIAALRRRLDDRVFDIVFVNAGISPPERRDAVHASRDEAAHVLLTNAVAPIRVARAFLDRVREGRGVIAFMSSGLGSVANKTDSYSDLYSAPARRRSIRCRAASPHRSLVSESPCWRSRQVGCAPIWAARMRRSASRRACAASSMCSSAAPVQASTASSIIAAAMSRGESGGRLFRRDRAARRQPPQKGGVVHPAFMRAG